MHTPKSVHAHAAVTQHIYSKYTQLHHSYTKRCTAHCILQQSPAFHGRCPPAEDPSSSKLLPSFEVLPRFPWKPALQWPCWSPVFRSSAALQWQNIKHGLWTTDACLLTAHKMARKSPHTVKQFPSKQTCGAHTSPQIQATLPVTHSMYISILLTQIRCISLHTLAKFFHPETMSSNKGHPPAKFCPQRKSCSPVLIHKYPDILCFHLSKSAPPKKKIKKIIINK